MAADDTIGTWFAIGNAVGFGLGAMSQFTLITALPAPFGQLLVGALVLVPLGVVPLIPVPDAGRKAVRESFGDLTRDLAVLIRLPLVLRIGVMFAMPCAAFTLTNAFGGLGPDFHVSAGMIDAANGFGATGVGLCAALVGRWVLRRLPGPLLYLTIGTAGACFTALVIGLPHTPLIYLLAVAGENAAQSIAQVSQNAIIFASIRRGSPIAASQFGLLSAAILLPYSYMQALDGYGYHLAGSVAGSFWMDAGVSLAGCAILFVPVLRWMRGGKLTAPDEDAPVGEPAAAC
jgi:PAT family beta-lactamase induction signal transducer AmpG